MLKFARVGLSELGREINRTHSTVIYYRDVYSLYIQKEIAKAKAMLQ
jgi:hypothetical protein